MTAAAWARIGLVATLLVSVQPRPALGQVAEDPAVGPSGLAEDEIVRGPVSPGGAFARSLLVPGWGHLASEAPTRAAFYVTAQSATAWMVLKSLSQRRSAERFRALEREVVMAELRIQGVTSPDSLRVLADDDPRIEAWDDLRETRSQQVEDWVSLGLFLTLLGAADAFVSAHLADFPEPLSLDVLPGAGPRGVEVRMSLPAPRLRAPW